MSKERDHLEKQTPGLCVEIEITPPSFLELMTAHLEDGDTEGALNILENVEAGRYDRICGQPTVPGTEYCEKHSNEESTDS